MSAEQMRDAALGELQAEADRGRAAKGALTRADKLRGMIARVAMHRDSLAALQADLVELLEEEPPPLAEGEEPCPKDHRNAVRIDTREGPQLVCPPPPAGCDRTIQLA